MKDTIPLEELTRLPKFALVTPSYRRDKIAFYWDKSGRFELYAMDLGTRQVTQLTEGQAPRGLRAGFVWTRDDQHLIFAKDHDGDERHNLFQLAVDTGEVTQLHRDPTTQEYAGQVAPDNRHMAVMSNRHGQLNIFTLDLTTLTWQQLTHFEAPAFARNWSEDGEWLAFSTNESQDLKNTDGYLVKHDGSEIKKVLSIRDGARDILGPWHPDSQRLAVMSDASGTVRPGVLTLDSGDVHWLGEEGVEAYATQFSQWGQWLGTLRNQDATIMPVLYDVEMGAARELHLPEGVAVGSHFVLDDTKLLVQHAAAKRRPELVLYDLESDTHEVLLAAEYGSINPSCFVSDAYIRYPSFDGQDVPALLYKPDEIVGQLPAVVIVHGGPTAQFFRGFAPYAQYLVSQGYVVLQPNIRGSTGYGVLWRDANFKDWGGGDLEDVAAGAAYLKTLPYVDPERLGIFGGSFGGFMSYVAVVKKPELFKVGVPWIGITDLHKMYEEDMEHFKYFLRRQMGDPDQDFALWRDRSAIEFAEQLQAKLLIVHGVNDPRCPISQSRMFRDKLLALGYKEGQDPEDDFEYHEFGDEGHGPSGDIQGTIRTYRLLTDFLKRRL